MTRLALVGAAVSFAAWAVAVAKLKMENGKWKMKDRPQFSILHSKFSIHTAVFVFFAAIAVQYAGAKHGGTNAPPNGASPSNGNVELKMENVELRNLSPLIENEQFHNSPFYILHSQLSPQFPFRLESVATNDSYSYAMPTNGTRYARWWKRGGYEDVFRLDLDGMIFPFGTNLCSSLWVYTWGMAGARLADASIRIAATGVPMSAVPFASQFWSAALPGGARRLTWQDFALNRDTNTPVSAQLDLYPSGDFVARSNLVETVYRRVNPDDWDDDGYPNDIDPNPYAFEEGGFGPHQELPQGANTNHYYWIDIVVDHANARVMFNGAGYSHLPDPDFIAKAGETNRVVLLLGKPYTIDCVMPVRVVDREDSEIEVYNGGSSVDVVWPVYVDFGPRMRSGGGVGATIWPARAAGGNFFWPDNFCCYSFAADATPIFDCDGTCGCGGCYTGEIVYEIGGHSMPYGGVYCGCSHEGDPEQGGDDPPETPSGPHVSVSFSKDTIVFEDEYTNSVSDVVARRSTDSELTCEVYGGTNGGHYAFALYDDGRLAKKSGSNLPRSGTVAAGETFLIKIKYEAQSASVDVGDISAIGTFTENDTGASLSGEATLTAVKVAIRPVVGREGCEFRHRMGVREQFEIIMSPQGVQHSVQCASDWQPPGTNSVLYKCPLGAALNGVSMNVAGVSYTPTLTVVEPTGIICTNGYDMCAADYTAMQLDPYVTPLDVCFSGIAMMEVPTTTVGPSGYFTNELFSSIWYHTKARGAGAWKKISPDNFFFRDTASFAETCPSPFADGTIDWEIVLGWGPRESADDDSPLEMVPTHYHQVFTIDAQGGLRIDKFGQWIKQFADGTITNSIGISKEGGEP